MFCDEISSCAGRVSGAGHVCSGHDEGHGLIRCKGGHVSNAQLLPALGDHQHQLQIAGTLRGQIGGIREGLRVGVVQRDVGTALHALAVAGSREIGRSCCQCVEVCIHVLLRGYGISSIDLGQILCADVEGLVLGAVDHGDQNSNVFVTGLCRCGINVEQAGQLNAKAVPVADLITDLDIHDGGAAILLAMAAAVCAVVNGGYLMQPYVVSEILDDSGNVVEKTEPTVIRQVISEETSSIMRDMILSVVEEGTAGNGVGHKINPPFDRKNRIPECSILFIPFLPERCKGFGAEFTAFSQEYHPSWVRPFTCVSLVLTRFNRLGV